MKHLIIPSGQQFSLDITLGCGQVFRWERTGDGLWHGIVEGRVIRMRQDGKRISYDGASREFVRQYFALDLDLGPVLSSIDRDPVIHDAICRCSGLRIVRQPAWECLVSYICATNSNISTIRRRIESIAETFGRPVKYRETTRYAFPESEDIAAGGREGLAGCKLGYREPYILGTSGSITDPGCWEKEIRNLLYGRGRKELMKLPGIGPKAADCILLFAFQKYEAFPVDVWIRRIMQQHYLPDLGTGSPLTTREYDTIRQFAREHFGEYCGYAQEYLYAARGEKK